MQQPVILFNGGQHKVLQLCWGDERKDYVTATVDGKYTKFRDVKSSRKYDDEIVIDLEQAVIGAPSTIEQAANVIKRKIEAYEEIICDMSIDFVESFREARKAPFASNSLLEQADLIEKLGYVVDGLHEVLEVVLMKGDSNA